MKLNANKLAERSMKVIINAYGTVEKPSQITEDQLKNIVFGDQKRRSR